MYAWRKVDGGGRLRTISSRYSMNMNESSPCFSRMLYLLMRSQGMIHPNRLSSCGGTRSSSGPRNVLGAYTFLKRGRSRRKPTMDAPKMAPLTTSDVTIADVEGEAAVAACACTPEGSDSSSTAAAALAASSVGFDPAMLIAGVVVFLLVLFAAGPQGRWE